jgi:hypothetical protein
LKDFTGVVTVPNLRELPEFELHPNIENSWSRLGNEPTIEKEKRFKP